MKRFTMTLLSASLLGFASAASAAEIDVMTQNQYLGADIAPLILAIGTPGFNDAVVTALEHIADNRSQERFNALAALITRRSPHLVGLQEVWEFKCIPAVPELEGYPCNDPSIAGAFSDHLAGTLAALGGGYAAVAKVENFSVQSYGPYPGIPFYIGNVPAFLQVMDRDVILARSDVAAAPVALPCFDGAHVSADGCNFQYDLPLGDLGSVKRGFVAVNATVDGVGYRFINTHLEVQGTDVIPGEIQALQANELLTTALTTTPADRRLIIVGDFNSSPTDPASSLPTPYTQLTLAGLHDAWLLRPGATPGLSCCQLEDLANQVSVLNNRIDLIVTRELPRKVKDARLLGEVSADRTKPPGLGLWPSDHASVAARLQY